MHLKQARLPIPPRPHTNLVEPTSFKKLEPQGDFQRPLASRGATDFASGTVPWGPHRPQPKVPKKQPCRAGGFTWSYRAGAGWAESFPLNPLPLTACVGHEFGVVAEAVARRQGAWPHALASKHFECAGGDASQHARPLHSAPNEGIVREVGYRLSDRKSTRLNSSHRL